MANVLYVSIIFSVFAVIHGFHPLQEYETVGVNISNWIISPSVELMSDSRERNGAEFMKDTHYFMPQQIHDNKAFDKFVEYKKKSGSNSEKSYYSKKTGLDIIKKCIDHRAVSFFANSDVTLLRHTKGYSIPINWDLIGNDKWESSGNDKWKRDQIFTHIAEYGNEPMIINWVLTNEEILPFDTKTISDELPDAIIKNFKITNYLSYDEMMLCALLVVVGPTQFYNAGDRMNDGKVVNGYPIRGYIAGAVGARFELPGKMEHALMINTPSPDSEKMIDIIFNEQHSQNEDDYENWGENTVNTRLLYERYYMVYQVYLRWTSWTMRNKGKHQGKKGYYSCTGLGAGVWAIDNAKQSAMIVDVVADLIKTELQKTAKEGTVVDFTFYPYIDYSILKMKDATYAQPFGEEGPSFMIGETKIGGIIVRFSLNSPASIDKKNADYIIFELYAYDSNSAPGNEVHIIGSRNNPDITNTLWLHASGDPAAAVSSDIMWTQSVITNTRLAGRIKVFAGPKGKTEKPIHIELPKGDSKQKGGSRRKLAASEPNKVGEALHLLGISIILLVTLVMSYFFIYR